MKKKKMLATPKFSTTIENCGSVAHVIYQFFIVIALPQAPERHREGEREARDIFPFVMEYIRAAMLTSTLPPFFPVSPTLASSIIISTCSRNSLRHSTRFFSLVPPPFHGWNTQQKSRNRKRRMPSGFSSNQSPQQSQRRLHHRCLR